MLLLPSEFRKVLKYINERLIRWVMRKYKRFSKGKKFSKAYEWLVEYAAHNRNEFLHWVKGFVPYPRQVNKEYKLMNKRVKCEEPCDGRLSSMVPREGWVKFPPLTRQQN